MNAMEDTRVEGHGLVEIQVNAGSARFQSPGSTPGYFRKSEWFYLPGIVLPFGPVWFPGPGSFFGWCHSSRNNMTIEPVSPPDGNIPSLPH